MHKDNKEILKVYFNSACLVCNAGINAQKNKTTACPIQWKDIHENNLLVNELDKNLSTVRKYLHVTDKNNRQHIGIDAFILLWTNSPKERWKAKIFSLPIVKQLFQLGYFVFANALYFRNRQKNRW